jgi:hypothetical protein
LLKYGDRVALLSKLGKKRKDRLVLAPRYGVLSPESGFVEVFVLGRAGEPGEMNVFDPCRVGRSEDGSHVVDGSNIVDDNSDRMFWKCGYLVGFWALDFIPTQLAHVVDNRDVWTNEAFENLFGGLSLACDVMALVQSEYCAWPVAPRGTCLKSLWHIALYLLAAIQP